MSELETRIIDGEVWAKVPDGYAVLPLEATGEMYMLGGNTPLSNVGKYGLDRRGRIGDLAARDTWARMVARFTDDTRKDRFQLSMEDQHQSETRALHEEFDRIRRERITLKEKYFKRFPEAKRA